MKCGLMLPDKNLLVGESHNTLNFSVKILTIYILDRFQIFYKYMDTMNGTCCDQTRKKHDPCMKLEIRQTGVSFRRMQQIILRCSLKSQSRFSLFSLQSMESVSGAGG